MVELNKAAKAKRSGHARWFLLGMGLGSVVAYLSVPQLRERLKRQFVGDPRSLGRGINILLQKLRSITQHGSSFYGEATQAMGRTMQRSNDEETLKRIYAVTKTHTANPVDVELQDGVVRLSGSVLRTEIKDLIASIERLPGVRQVIDQLA